VDITRSCYFFCFFVGTFPCVFLFFFLLCDTPFPFPPGGPGFTARVSDSYTYLFLWALCACLFFCLSHFSGFIFFFFWCRVSVPAQWRERIISFDFHLTCDLVCLFSFLFLFDCPFAPHRVPPFQDLLTPLVVFGDRGSREDGSGQGEFLGARIGQSFSFFPFFLFPFLGSTRVPPPPPFFPWVTERWEVKFVFVLLFVCSLLFFFFPFWFLVIVPCPPFPV